MATRRITFEVDTSKLFDTLHAMEGNTEPLGTRLVASLLAEPGFADLVGMAVYGVEVVTEPQSQGEPS